MMIDTVFLSLAAFALAFVWMRYYVDSNLICLLGALAACLAFYFAVKALFGKRQKQKKPDKKRRAQMQNLARYLAFLPTDEAARLFATLPKGEGVMRRCCFGIGALDGEKFCALVKAAVKSGAKMLEVFAASFDKAVLQAYKTAPIAVRLFDGQAAFCLLEKHGALPDAVFAKKRKPLLENGFFKAVFDRSRAKYYLISSLFLLLTSFVSFFRLYYLISGTVLFFLFVYARFNRRFNVPQPDALP